MARRSLTVAAGCLLLSAQSSMGFLAPGAGFKSVRRCRAVERLQSSVGAADDYLSNLEKPDEMEGEKPLDGGYLAQLEKETANEPTPLEEPASEGGRMDGKRVIVFGASGRTGRQVVKQLCAEGATVVAAVRNRKKADFLEKFGPVEFKKINVVCDDKSDIASAVRGCDAAVVATGFVPGFPPDPFGAVKVDFLGTRTIAGACADEQVGKLVLVSSLLTNGLAAGQALNPNYVLLNAFGGILIMKRLAEKYIENEDSLKDWTIVRPGGLKDAPPKGNIVFGSRDTLFNGGISRQQVAQVVVESILAPEASRKIVEIIAKDDATPVDFATGFSSCE